MNLVDTLEATVNSRGYSTRNTEQDDKHGDGVGDDDDVVVTVPVHLFPHMRLARDTQELQKNMPSADGADCAQGTLDDDDDDGEPSLVLSPIDVTRACFQPAITAWVIECCGDYFSSIESRRMRRDWATQKPFSPKMWMQRMFERSATLRKVAIDMWEQHCAGFDKDAVSRDMPDPTKLSRDPATGAKVFFVVHLVKQVVEYLGLDRDYSAWVYYVVALSVFHDYITFDHAGVPGLENDLDALHDLFGWKDNCSHITASNPNDPLCRTLLQDFPLWCANTTAPNRGSLVNMFGREAILVLRSVMELDPTLKGGLNVYARESEKDATRRLITQHLKDSETATDNEKTAAQIVNQQISHLIEICPILNSAGNTRGGSGRGTSTTMAIATRDIKHDASVVFNSALAETENVQRIRDMARSLPPRPFHVEAPYEEVDSDTDADDPSVEVRRRVRRFYTDDDSPGTETSALDASAHDSSVTATANSTVAGAGSSAATDADSSVVRPLKRRRFADPSITASKLPSTSADYCGAAAADMLEFIGRSEHRRLCTMGNNEEATGGLGVYENMIETLETRATMLAIHKADIQAKIDRLYQVGSVLEREKARKYIGSGPHDSIQCCCQQHATDNSRDAHVRRAPWSSLALFARSSLAANVQGNTTVVYPMDFRCACYRNPGGTPPVWKNITLHAPLFIDNNYRWSPLPHYLTVKRDTDVPGVPSKRVANTPRSGFKVALTPTRSNGFGESVGLNYDSWDAKTPDELMPSKITSVAHMDDRMHARQRTARMLIPLLLVVTGIGKSTRSVIAGDDDPQSDISKLFVEYARDNRGAILEWIGGVLRGFYGISDAVTQIMRTSPADHMRRDEPGKQVVFASSPADEESVPSGDESMDDASGGGAATSASGGGNASGGSNASVSGGSNASVSGGSNASGGGTVSGGSNASGAGTTSAGRMSGYDADDSSSASSDGNLIVGGVNYSARATVKLPFFRCTDAVRGRWPLSRLSVAGSTWATAENMSIIRSDRSLMREAMLEACLDYHGVPTEALTVEELVRFAQETIVTCAERSSWPTSYFWGDNYDDTKPSLNGFTMRDLKRIASIPEPPVSVVLLNRQDF